MDIFNVSSVNNVAHTKSVKTADINENTSFKDFIMDALNNVNTLELESTRMTEDFIAGRTDNIHSVMIASEKASISLQFVMEVRNKVLEAYQEIMRMQV